MTMVRPSLRFRSRNKLDDLLAVAGVEIARRLVGEQHARLIDQRAGDGGTLHFAAGKLARPVLEAMAQADALEQFRGPPAQSRAGSRASSTTECAIICGISTFSSVLSSGSRW